MLNAPIEGGLGKGFPPSNRKGRELLGSLTLFSKEADFLNLGSPGKKWRLHHKARPFHLIKLYKIFPSVPFFFTLGIARISLLEATKLQMFKFKPNVWDTSCSEIEADHKLQISSTEEYSPWSQNTNKN